MIYIAAEEKAYLFFIFPRLRNLIVIAMNRLTTNTSSIAAPQPRKLEGKSFLLLDERDLGDSDMFIKQEEFCDPREDLCNENKASETSEDLGCYYTTNATDERDHLSPTYLSAIDLYIYGVRCNECDSNLLF